MDDVAVVICTCKKYENIIKICDQYLEQFWDTCNYTKYVVTDNKVDINSNAVQIVSQNSNWGGRLREALSDYINENIILLILDDFIIEETVNEEALNEYINLMKTNPSIAHILLNTVDDKKNKSFNKTLFQQGKYAKYKTSLQIGIWRKEDLLLCVKNEYTPWEVELYGNMRTYKSDKLYLCLKNKKDKPFFYNDGFFVVQGFVNQRELQRLNKKLDTTLSIGSLPVTTKIIRDNISFFPRVIRRFKIILAFVYYKYISREIKEH
ncbi:hypothetical protein [Thomasclavelia spiroformis]|mgnify:CR=1 FL=1|uniref:hypothetical protein n=1 Tax=Thomasclavelia spiroformis TaxID=29348 RepID=UPI0026DC0428|nr:hypothetical protein [Thomasclavelia spiroformis]